MELLKFPRDEFIFNWTKVGSKARISDINTLTFQSVRENDFGYYQCELKEMGRVVLTMVRALYRDESSTEHPPLGIIMKVVINLTLYAL